MEEYAELCLALGFDVHDMDLMDLYLLAGRIWDDALVMKRRLELSIGRATLVDDEAIATLTAEEKRQIRERILGVVPISARSPNTPGCK